MSVQPILSPLSASQYMACNSAINVIKNGTFEEIKNILKSGTVNFQEMEDGQTLLNLFCERSFLTVSDNNNILEIIEILSSKVDVNAKDKSDDTPLNKIISKEIVSVSLSKRIIKILLDKGAIIDESLGHCPLHPAALNGNWLALDTLLDHVDPNNCEYLNRAEDSAQPIFYTLVLCDQLYILEKLLEISPASVNILDNHGNTLLHKAILSGRIKIILILLNCDNIDLEVKDREGKTPFVIAALNQNTDIMAMLVEKGASRAIDPKVFDHITDEEADILRSFNITKKAD
ncbi:MAG: hypothetical protein ChlgKO_12550 [Chlamydiales bacterium]